MTTRRTDRGTEQTNKPTRSSAPKATTSRTVQATRSPCTLQAREPRETMVKNHTSPEEPCRTDATKACRRQTKFATCQLKHSINIQHATTRVVLDVAQTPQDDLDRGAPVRAVRIGLQDAETPNRIVELARIRRLLGALDDPGSVVVALAFD